MFTRDHIPTWVFKLAIVAATVVWGGSFTVIKEALDQVPPGWLLGMRFAASAAVIALLFHRRMRAHIDRAHLRAGVRLGLTFGIAYLAQNVGLTDTTPGKNAFLTATYCVMVPFMNAVLLRRRPAVRNVVAAFACLGGVGLVAMGGIGKAQGIDFGLRIGDTLTLVGAVFFAINIVQVARLPKGTDAIVVTAIELAVCSILALAWGICTEPLPPAAAFTQDFWMQMAYLVLLSTVYTTVAQNVAQQHVPPSQAALLLSLESVFGALFSVLFYGEQVTLPLLLGFAMIFVSVVTSELAPETDG